MGLRKSDAFCGTPYWMFAKDISEFNSRGLGIPEDRAAILVFDAKKLQEVEGTDGYVFTEPNNKREALLGVMQFKEHLIAFEERLAALPTVDEKVQLLEDEVFKNLNTKDDLENAPYIAVNLISLLNRESRENAQNPSSISAERVRKLGVIADRLNYETRMIELSSDLLNQIILTRNAFAEGRKNKMEYMSSWPDFVIKTTNDHLQDEEIDDKYRQKFLQVIEEAQKCKVDLGLSNEQK